MLAPRVIFGSDRYVAYIYLINLTSQGTATVYLFTFQVNYLGQLTLAFGGEVGLTAELLAATLRDNFFLSESAFIVVVGRFIVLALACGRC